MTLDQEELVWEFKMLLVSHKHAYCSLCSLELVYYEKTCNLFLTHIVQKTGFKLNNICMSYTKHFNCQSNGYTIYVILLNDVTSIKTNTKRNEI